MYKLHYSPGNANLTPHMMLKAIGVDYELILVDRASNAHKSPEYLKLNPAGRIPVLVDGDFTLPETAAICLYLADKHPEAELAPALNTEKRAVLYRWLMYFTNTIQTEVLMFYYPDRYTADGSEEAAANVKAAAAERLGEMLTIVDEAMGTSGPYMLGEKLSLLDFYLFMLCRWCRLIENKPRSFSNLDAFIRQMEVNPAVIGAFETEGIAQPWT
ncbi:MAG: glutathione S-transferase family protein [Alphaproteobacteria bacterium]|nr:glutathione S-transferase family protein [Rhodospirillales bacterium]MCW9045811.1 glutathione S-transferase family protein [Alphaproteobacteria bacterium]